MPMTPPDISIIVATYNAEAELGHCLDSIASQQNVNLEVLISDGASTDGTRQVLSGYVGQNIQWRSSSDDGIYDAWNKVLGQVSGRYIMFLGADDRLMSENACSHLVDALDNASEQSPFRMGYGRVHLMAGESTVECLGTGEYSKNADLLAQEWPFSHTGLLFSRDIFEEVGEFSTSYRAAGDYEHFVRCMIKLDVKLVRVDEDIAVMQAGGISTSRKGRLLTYSEVVAIRKQFALIPRIPLWLAKNLVSSSVVFVVGKWFPGRVVVFLANIYRALTGRKPRPEYL